MSSKLSPGDRAGIRAKMSPVSSLIAGSYGTMDVWNVVQEITRENDFRRAKNNGGDTYWTWEQWDRFIAAVETVHSDATNSNFVMGLYQTRRRVQQAKSDGLSPWQFHLAMKAVIGHYENIESENAAKSRALEERAKQRAYVTLRDEFAVKERARLDAKEMVAKERGYNSGGARSRRPAPEVEA